MDNVIISIIVPCYNQAQYLSEVLLSILNQEFLKWECIIINDGSKDNTKEISENWIVKDQRFKYIEIENKGVSNARNVGIKMASGKYILPVDADDKISSDYIRIAISKLDENNGLKLVYCKAKKFGKVQDDWILEPFSLPKLACTNMIFCSAIFYKDDWLRVGGYDVNMVNGLEDWEFWISLLKDGGNVYQINKICFFYRVKEVSRSTSFNRKQKLEIYNYLCSKHPFFFAKHLGNNISLYRQNRKLIQKLNYLEKSKKGAIKNLFSVLFIKKEK